MSRPGAGVNYSLRPLLQPGPISRWLTTRWARN